MPPPRSTALLTCFALLVIVLGSFAALPAHAQGVGRVEQTNSNIGTYYYHVEPGATTVQVHVLGTVQAPGLYELTEGTTLGQLLALAGGPVFSPRQRSDRRKVHVQLHRRHGDTLLLVYETMQAGIVAAEAGNPILQDGDVLTVEVIERRGLRWPDFISVIGTAASVGLLIQQLSE